jgi:hypothetical protein
VALESGDYLTNGIQLFRFEGYLPQGEGAILEDARSARVWSVPLSEFASMKLKAVKPLQKGIKANA